MISRFFILRPILSCVIALLTILGGLLTGPELEVARFPDISPPSIRVNLRYTGASALTIENSVTQVVEQQLTGLDDLLYFSSRSSSEGSADISFFFEQGTNADIAQMQIQNRIQNITRKLPEQVQKNGVNVRKVSDDTLQQIAFFCDNGTLSQEDVADFVASVVQDPISRINGIGDVSLMGAQYAVRIWLDLNKLWSYKLNPQDVVSAIKAQNAQLSSGQLGALPNYDETKLNITIESRELLNTTHDFEDILLKVENNGAVVRIKDVATVEMGRENYTFNGTYNGYPSASLQLNLTDGANAVETAGRVSAFLEELKPIFPDGIKYAIAYDTVPYVTASLNEVGQTLLEALILVALVILLFLRSLRSTLIVCITIPVVLSGTAMILWAFNYSINTLTLFAMVLSIGLLVDDAIVVVENVNRLISEQKISPKQAAIQSMNEISPALIGVGLVISAVFTPMSFFSGATGNIYRQFSLTIVSAMLMSIAVALIITPALCAAILKDTHQQNTAKPKSGLFFKARNLFMRTAEYFVNHIFLAFILTVATAVCSALLFRAIPSSFLPVEDQGVLIARIVLPSGATKPQAEIIAHQVEQYFLKEEAETVEGVALTLGAGGGGSRGQSTAVLYIKLTPWEMRKTKDKSASAIRRRAAGVFLNNPDAKINILLPPTIRGMGGSSGFNVFIENIMGNDHDDFMRDVDEIIAEANASPLIENVRTDALPDSPQLNIKFNDLAAAQRHLSASTINDNIEITLAGSYVNDFIDRGRIKKVYVQADAPFRTTVADLKKLYLRNSEGDMIPFSTFARADFGYGPIQTQRFNGISAVPLTGDPKPGISSGQAMDEIARIITSHPGHYSPGWQGISYQEKLSGEQSGKLFLLSAAIVFLCLAALYESWTIPAAVMLVIPFGILGALLMTWSRGLVNDVYLQIGLLTCGGLAAKNAILLIEYAHHFRMSGLGIKKSALKAASIRFRPIIMTSLAFLFGVAPLMFAHGAGAASQISIGSAIVGGTAFATFVGVIFIPSYFVIIGAIFLKRHKKRGESPNRS